MKDHEPGIQTAKQMINDYIQMERSDFAKRINALLWIHGSKDEQPAFHRLVVFSGKQRHSIKFYHTELDDATRIPGGDLRLKKRVDAFFRLLERDAPIEQTD